MTPGRWIAIGLLVLVVYGALIGVAWNERGLRLATNARMPRADYGRSDGQHATKDILEVGQDPDQPQLPERER